MARPTGVRQVYAGFSPRVGAAVIDALLGAVTAVAALLRRRLKMSDTFLDRVLHFFDYLRSERGYRQRLCESDDSYHDGRVQFESDRLCIRVAEEHRQSYVEFAPAGAGLDPDDWRDFDLVLRALGRDLGPDVRIVEGEGSLEELAGLLKAHIEEIETFFAPSNLRAARRKLHAAETKRAREIYGPDVEV